MASIEKRKGKTGTGYLVSIRRRGHPPIYETFDSLAEAKAFAARTEANISEKKHYGVEVARVLELGDAVVLGDAVERAVGRCGAHPDALRRRHQERAVLLAIEALKQADTREAEEALHRTVQELHILRTLQRPGQYIGLAWSSDGQRLAASGTTGAAVWDPDSGKLLYSKEITEGMINRLAFSPDSSLLVLPSEGADPVSTCYVSILDAHTGQELLTFPAHDAFMWWRHAISSPRGLHETRELISLCIHARLIGNIVSPLDLPRGRVGRSTRDSSTAD